MIKIVDSLFIGDDHDCRTCGNEYSVIHTCKTCHQNVLGYRKSLPQNHPNYLIYELGNHLYLNMVDMEQELLPRFTHPIMRAAMDFIQRNIFNKPVLVHCNQGFSRSPSIVLLYLAREKVISASSYIDAKKEFCGLYKNFMPGKGIELYMNKNWRELMELDTAS